MPPEDFTLPILTGVRTHFLTATAAARHMVRQGTGVLLTLSSSAAVATSDRASAMTGTVVNLTCGSTVD